jgi:predicted enzyme related to lactoylglutathione lyase
MGNQIAHYEIRANDPDAARAFYGELFGWTFPPAPEPGYTYIDNGVSGSLPGGIGQAAGGHGLVTFFIGVDDVAGTLEQVERMGGKVVLPATSVPGVTFALFSDPQGQIIGVSHSE